MFGIGGTELAIILIFAFLIFGPDKLPAIAKTVGQAIAKFRDVQNEMNQVVKEEVYDPDRDQDNPFQRPLDKMANLDKREVKTETFAERKARHDRERAERQAAMAAQAQKTADAAGAPAAPADAPAQKGGYDWRIIVPWPHRRTPQTALLSALPPPSRQRRLPRQPPRRSPSLPRSHARR